jgi:hypothetical protein
MTKIQVSKNKRKFNRTSLVLECAIVVVVKKISEREREKKVVKKIVYLFILEIVT